MAFTANPCGGSFAGQIAELGNRVGELSLKHCPAERQQFSGTQELLLGTAAEAMAGRARSTSHRVFVRPAVPLPLDALDSYFARFGQVTDVYAPKSSSRLVAFVSFLEPEAVERVMASQTHTIAGEAFGPLHSCRGATAAGSWTAGALRLLGCGARTCRRSCAPARIPTFAGRAAAEGQCVCCLGRQNVAVG